MIQERLVRWLWTQITVLNDSSYHRDWLEEKRFLLDQLDQLSEDGTWWSDPEWEWFLNRCLDFLGAPK